MKYSIPYGKQQIEFEAPERSVIFTGEMTNIPKVEDLRNSVLSALDNPIGTPPLKELAKGKKNIVFLFEDSTRDTPLAEIMPVVIGYLNANGIKDDVMSFLSAPGTHRVMTKQEIIAKLGPDIVGRFMVRQHDATLLGDMVDLGFVDAGGYKIPVHVNRYALDADLLIGLGNIVPHSDAGYSGGAKIVQPGVCDFVTTSATHLTAGLCPDIPLGMIKGNPCRQGIEEVAKIVGLSFILNVVKNYEGNVAGIFTGDFIKAHRTGVSLAEKSFKVDMPALADIVVVSSSPADLDYWQAEKGVTGAYFAVKPGGIIVFAAPCYEGLAHNHPRFREWLSLPLDEVIKGLKAASPEDVNADIVSAVLAVCNCRIRNRAKIFVVSDGLTEEDLAAMQYTRFSTVQSALDEAMRLIPNAKIGILPKGGISLPVLENI
ncbi:MAG: nickel-dependent lactate racemase [Synergistaceae bacterium]|nr:nickel-dependent lactate racemase [Synergistaceae bacterium]